MEQINLKTKIGTLWVVANSKGITQISWKDQGHVNKKSKVLVQAKDELLEYFNGKKVKFSFPIYLTGTEFQKKVWHELTQIPFGQTISYGELAKKIANPKAFRAVGSANGKNPLPIVIPCHRVINANGELGGYSGGIDIKKFLLKIEGVR
jgi:methylated-DNA-[protein]-cysteine S-methyltransferase